MAILFEVVRDGMHFSARADTGAPFAIGSKVRYRSKTSGVDRYGLSNDAPNFGSADAATLRYFAHEYRTIHAFWADFIEPTALCEGQSFLSLNTYDRARFTFGFGQFAAHVPDGDFIKWFRDMLRRPEAELYFPNLEVRAGRIVKVGVTATVAMETAETTMPLQLYLNPTLDEVEDAEVIAAAKVIHWTRNYPDAQLLQVQHMINTARALVINADKRLGLDGKTADLCCIIMDVLHQGRGKYAELQKALLAGNPFAALLEIGALNEPGRVANLKAAMTSRRGALMAKTWSRSAANFV